MDYRKHRKLVTEAINSGCQTAAQLALYWRIKKKCDVFASANRHRTDTF